jgi:hypothetical protein
LRWGECSFISWSYLEVGGLKGSNTRVLLVLQLGVGMALMDRSPTSTQPAPYGLDHEHNGLWIKKIVLEALKEYALA